MDCDVSSAANILKEKPLKENITLKSVFSSWPKYGAKVKLSFHQGQKKIILS